MAKRKRSFECEDGEWEDLRLLAESQNRSRPGQLSYIIQQAIEKDRKENGDFWEQQKGKKKKPGK